MKLKRSKLSENQTVRLCEHFVCRHTSPHGRRSGRGQQEHSGSVLPSAARDHCRAGRGREPAAGRGRDRRELLRWSTQGQARPRSCRQGGGVRHPQAWRPRLHDDAAERLAHPLGPHHKHQGNAGSSGLYRRLLRLRQPRRLGLPTSPHQPSAALRRSPGQPHQWHRELLEPGQATSAQATTAFQNTTSISSSKSASGASTTARLQSSSQPSRPRSSSQTCRLS